MNEIDIRGDKDDGTTVEVSPFKYSIRGFENAEQSDFDYEILSSAAEEKKDNEIECFNI